MLNQIEITLKIEALREILTKEYPSEVFPLKVLVELYETAIGVKTCPYTKIVCEDFQCKACPIWARDSGLARSY